MISVKVKDRNRKVMCPDLGNLNGWMLTSHFCQPPQVTQAFTSAYKYSVDNLDFVKKNSTEIHRNRPKFTKIPHYSNGGGITKACNEGIIAYGNYETLKMPIIRKRLNYRTKTGK